MAIVPCNMFSSLTTAKDFSVGRVSSYDVSGRNADAWRIEPGETRALAEIEGPGVISHIWFTIASPDPLYLRKLILRMYWDGEKTPSVETPAGDFFGLGHARTYSYQCAPFNTSCFEQCVVGGGVAMNSWFQMPFRKHARVTVENISPNNLPWFFYTINFSLTDVDDDDAYFHAQFRRSNPLTYGQDHVMIDGVRGKGQYVGACMAWQQNNANWWGEGEIKMFLDGDGEFPTICGTGTEDYFGGAWCFNDTFSAPFMGYPYSTDPKGGAFPKAGTRHSLYRFHVMDPVRFRQDLKVTMQAIGWRAESRYLPLQDDISSVVYWYQSEPHATFPQLGDRNALEVI